MKKETQVKKRSRATPKKEKVAAIKIEPVKEKTSPAIEQEKVKNFIRAVGRRKSAVARVRLYPEGSGKIEINSKDYREFLPYFELHQKVTAPLKLVGKRNNFNWTIKVAGGGPVGQAEACRLGITRALIKFNQNDKKILRAAGFVTRDPRVKERKKFGLKRARRAPQWQKR